MVKDRINDWKKQAENDLQWAKHSLEGGFYAQACFVAQQAAEEVMKAYCFFKGFDIIKTHSLFQIVRSLKENDVLEKNARELDLYYISGRYPDAFPAGAPFELITKRQAVQALQASREIYQILEKRMGFSNG